MTPSSVTTNLQRYALYFAPAAEHPLWRAGCDWLGRDAHRGQPIKPPRSAQVSTPWRYGFHATLKAPFRLTDGRAEAAFLEALSTWARQQGAFLMPGLEVSVLSDFLALLPVQTVQAHEPLRRLCDWCDACVLDLDTWRAPASPVEARRYDDAPLSPRQRLHLSRHGYPHVLDDWRFHMTLSNRLTAAQIAPLRAEATDHFAQALNEPLHCDAVCLFTEAQPGAPFVLAHRFALGER